MNMQLNSRLCAVFSWYLYILSIVYAVVVFKIGKTWS